MESRKYFISTTGCFLLHHFNPARWLGRPRGYDCVHSGPLGCAAAEVGHLLGVRHLVVVETRQLIGQLGVVAAQVSHTHVATPGRIAPRHELAGQGARSKTKS